MTYCIGIKTKEGLVFASDSRTNAGMDNVNIYSKMFTHDVDDRTIDSHIKRIRKKFRKIDPEFKSINTLYGSGYKWK